MKHIKTTKKRIDANRSSTFKYIHKQNTTQTGSLNRIKRDNFIPDSSGVVKSFRVGSIV